MNLVTGATGLVGTAICLDLLKSGREVRAMVRRDSDRSWARKVFAFYNAEQLFEHIQWFEGDVLDLEDVENALHGIEYVFHTAAKVSFNPADEVEMMKVNVGGTENMVNLASHSGVRKFCHISSTAALGRSKPDQTIDENNNWEQSSLNSPYAISKYGAEREVWRAYEEGLPAVILNPSVIIGPGNPQRSSGAMLARMARGFTHYPIGANGFVGLNDVSAAALHLTFGDFTGERYLVNAENLPYRRVFEMMADALEVPRPARPATPYMLKAARRLQAFRQRLTGQRAILTRASVRTASNRVFYKNDKLLATGFEFQRMEDVIASAADFFRQHSSG